MDIFCCKFEDCNLQAVDVIQFAYVITRDAGIMPTLQLQPYGSMGQLEYTCHLTKQTCIAVLYFTIWSQNVCESAGRGFATRPSVDDYRSYSFPTWPPLQNFN